MTYINSNYRSVSPTSNERSQPLGRQITLNGLYIGFVKNVDDVQKNGRLQVWIPDLGSAPDDDQGWITVNYCSPFAGATNVETISKSDIKKFEGTQTSYGMWMVPPDINNEVAVMFVSGDPSKGIWIGCLYNQFMNQMVPGMAVDTKNWQYNGIPVPVAEYNKWDKSVTQPDSAYHPYQKTKFSGLGNQGLIRDQGRGITTSSARRESPSNVFGIITPGPVIDDTAPIESIRRKGGSSFIMDDGTGSEYVQLTTKTGAQIRLDETNGFVYLINRDGTAWVQMDQQGNIDIFGATNISMRAQRDVNIRADRNINIEAGQNIFMKAAMDTVETTTPFTYDVNNIPKPSNIPYWSYVGEGAGDGGNIVIQALNNLHSKTTNGAYLTVVNNDLNINVGNNISATTINGSQEFNAKLGAKITTDGALDIATTGNIRMGSKGSVNLVGGSDVVVCSSAGISLNSQSDLKAISAGSVQLTSISVDISGMLNVGELSTLGGGMIASGPITLGGPPIPVAQADPTASEGALSAGSASVAEVKPLNDKINILATWADNTTKFKRNSQAMQTMVSKLPTYEPCPEHEKFSFSFIAGYSPQINEGDKTYDGSAGAGNNASSTPVANTTPGANNTMIMGDPPTDSSVTKDINMQALRCQLIAHEGLKNQVYDDIGGLLSAGIGHLLRANEVTEYTLGSTVDSSQIDTWFTQDSITAVKTCQQLMGDVWSDFSDIRKRALADLAYNIGKTRLSKFINFIASMKAKDYNAAADALRNSKWYTQVGRRGPDLVTMISSNLDPTGCDKKFPG
jgi:GH24 family phage-related lysozyme (muramidase)